MQLIFYEYIVHYKAHTRFSSLKILWESQSQFVSKVRFLNMYVYI